MNTQPVIPPTGETRETMTCRCCHRELPLSSFERYRTGTYRPYCRQCKYIMYDRRYYEARKLAGG